MIRRTSKILLEIAAVFFAGVAVGAALLAWRLSTGPMSVDFLTPYVEDALAAPDGAFHTEIDRTVLSWGGWDRPIRIRALGMRAVDAEGRVVATVPEATVRLSGAALLTGTIAPTGLEVLSPRLRLTRTEEGRFVFGIEDGGEAGATAQTGTFLPRLLESLSHDDGGARLTRLNIADAHLTLVDRLSGHAWTAPRADLAFERDALGVEANLSLEVTGPGAPARLDGVALYDKGGRVIDIALSFDGLDPAPFLGGALPLGPVQGLSGRLGGTVSAGLALDGTLDAIEFDVSAGAGHVEVPARFGGTIDFAHLAARGTAREDLERIEIQEFRLTLPSDDSAGGAAAAGTAEAEPAPVLEGRGEVYGDGADRVMSLSATLHDLPVTRLGELWPPVVDPGSRRWVLANMTAGVIDEVGASLIMRRADGAAEPRIAWVRGAVRYSGLEVRYLEGLPSAAGVHGTASFDAESLVFDVAGGAVRDLPISDAEVRIEGLDASRQTLTVDGRLSGATREALDILDSEPFRYAQALGVDPAAVEGAAAGRLTVSFPLLDALTFDDVSIEAQAKLTDFAWHGGLFGADVTGGTLDLQVDKASMTAAGPLRVAGVPAQVRWTESFAAETAFPQELHVEAELDDDARAALGLEVGAALAGPVPVTVDVRANHQGRSRITAAADLRRAAVTVPELGWIKERGEDGQAHATINLDRDAPVEIEAFDIATPAWSAGGHMRLTREGRLLDLGTDIRKDPRTDASVTVEALEDGGRVVRITGRAFDASPFLDDLAGDDDDLGPRALVTATVERLYFGEDRHVSGAGVNAAVANGELARLALQGGVGKAGSLSVAYQPQAGRQTLHATSDDAGATLAALGLTNSVIGGSLEVVGADDPAAGEPFRGELRMDDFRVRDAPTLAKLVSLASPAGIVDALSAKEGMGFSEVRAPFTAQDDVVTVEDGRAIGPDLGITGSGTVALAENTIDLEGTVVPAYTLNSILGEIPLLGQLLVGEKGSGVFAATYRVHGPLDDPAVTGNPLAALTPGILRKLFDIFKAPPPGTAETPSDTEVPFNETPSELD